MEKFGIFELLDTLSALILPDGTASPPPKTNPRQDDAAFAPPAYAGPPPKPETSSSAALSSFLEKHEKTVKKVDGGK